MKFLLVALIPTSPSSRRPVPKPMQGPHPEVQGQQSGEVSCRTTENHPIPNPIHTVCLLNHIELSCQITPENTACITEFTEAVQHYWQAMESEAIFTTKGSTPPNPRGPTQANQPSKPKQTRQTRQDKTTDRKVVVSPLPPAGPVDTLGLTTTTERVTSRPTITLSAQVVQKGNAN